MKEITDIHRPFLWWLRERGIPCVYHRADTKSGIASGHPDFSILWCGRCLMIECKTEKGKLRQNQIDRIAYLEQAGNRVVIARSLEQCIDAAKDILCENKRGAEAVASGNGPSAKTETLSINDETGEVLAETRTKIGTMFVANWQREPYVFEVVAGGNRMVRKATGADLLKY